MTTPHLYFTPDVVTIPNLDNLQKYCFGGFTKPLYFANLSTLGMIRCTQKTRTNQRPSFSGWCENGSIRIPYLSIVGVNLRKLQGCSMTPME